VDEKTIEQARKGNRHAQTALLRDLQDPWYRLCLSMLGNADDARDATQETALRFLRQLHTFRGHSRLKTWSMGIAINVARETRRRGRLLPPDPWLVHGADGLSEDAPHVAMESGEEVRHVRDVLQQLPHRQQEAIVLRFFEDLSVDETAEIMQCAPGTVKATVHQALRSMRSKLESWGVIDAGETTETED